MLNDCINDFYSVEDTIDPNLADNEGNTSLIHAAQSGQHECLLVLLENFRPGLIIFDSKASKLMLDF